MPAPKKQIMGKGESVGRAGRSSSNAGSSAKSRGITREEKKANKKLVKQLRKEILTPERKKENKALMKELRKTNKLNEKKALAPKPKVTPRPNAADQSFRRDEMLALRAAHTRATKKAK